MKESEGNRLYDRIMATGIDIPLVENQMVAQEAKKSLTESLRRAQVFDIQNVADYYHATAYKEKGWGEKDFPNIAPPFHEYFMEFRVRKDWPTFDRTANIYSVGVLSTAFDHTQLKPEEAEIMMKNYPDARWTINSTLFMEDRKWEPKAWSRFMQSVQSDGQIAHNELKPEETIRGSWLGFLLDGRAHEMTPEEYRILQGDVALILYPCLLATSFLHCKNVTIETHEPPAKLSRAFRKRHGEPLVRFHLLNIEPMKTVLRREGQVEKLGLKSALHIVRGHFADYTERGLFGRHYGIYWFDQHLRGSREEGVVLKDYEVNPPQFQ